MKVYEIFEDLNWALDPNSNKVTDMGKNYLERDDMMLIVVNIKDLFNNLNKMQHINIDTGEGEIKNRVSGATNHWNSGGSMDPAIVGYSEYSHDFDFLNGRHRLVASYKMGEKWAPIIIQKSQFEFFKKHLRIKIM